MTPAQAGSTGIRSALNAALEAIPSFRECALLDFPDYPNPGDHLIWLGTVAWLRQVRLARVFYTASASRCSRKRLQRLPAGAPILLQGGGNLGDLWPKHQLFREEVIAANPERAVVILPQTVHFTEAAKLARSARVFNAHPNLTIFVRDTRSFEIASNHFVNCRNILAPDMAFALEGLLPSEGAPAAPEEGLCLRRHDQEMHLAFSPDRDPPGFVVDDWVSNRRAWLGLYWDIHPPHRVAKTLQRYLLENYGEPPERWIEWMAWRTWRRRTPWLPVRSAGLVHADCYRMSRYCRVVTDRLHGHILSTLLGIPNVLLPNAYHKNTAFFETWSNSLPLCRFAPAPSAVADCLTELAVLPPTQAG